MTDNDIEEIVSIYSNMPFVFPPDKSIFTKAYPYICIWKHMCLFPLGTGHHHEHRKRRPHLGNRTYSNFGKNVKCCLIFVAQFHQDP